MKNRGQALVEFVLIIPIFLMILLAIIDFGNIFHTKYNLQNDLDLITDLYKEQKEDEYLNYALNNQIELDIKKSNNYTTIEVAKNVKITTPLLDKVLKSPYSIKESITIYEK